MLQTNAEIHLFKRSVKNQHLGEKSQWIGQFLGINGLFWPQNDFSTTARKKTMCVIFGNFLVEWFAESLVISLYVIAEAIKLSSSQQPSHADINCFLFTLFVLSYVMTQFDQCLFWTISSQLWACLSRFKG